ncbi:MAG: hypothetical protein JOZ83_13570 [Silvibacterium sp.]|nr:hypothetical protein [Silvibacterium sp.]
MHMRRVLTALVLAGAIASALPGALIAQHAGGGHAAGFSGGGHVGGFAGGHVGGFSGGGFTAPHFTGPSPAYVQHGFPAPRMNPMPAPLTPGISRLPSVPRQYGGFSGARSPFGQLPAIHRSPFSPGGNRGWTNQPLRNAGNNQWHNEDHHGDHNHECRRPYYGGVTVYSGSYWWPYYSSWYWWPYWGYGYDDSSDSNSGYSQTPNQYSDQYPDQYSAPQAPDAAPDEDRPVYQPYQSQMGASPGVAIAEPAVTIVYKDGHWAQFRNYALTPTSLVIMDNASAGFSLRVPLELINLPATEQANRAAGVDFRLPVEN